MIKDQIASLVEVLYKSSLINESIWLENNLKITNLILISSVYRPPSSYVQWINTFSLQMEKAASAAYEIHFQGVFNINLLSDETQSRT